MKFFQNRAVAVIIALLVVIGSTLIAGRANLIKNCKAQEAAFFSVSEGKAPVYYIDQLISASASLANVTEKYDTTGAASSIRDARRELVKAEEARDISEIYAAAENLIAVVSTVDSKSISDSADRMICEDNLSIVAGASRELEQSDYNVNVTFFLETVYERFPSSLFAKLFSIKAPELYA